MYKYVQLLLFFVGLASAHAQVSNIETAKVITYLDSIALIERTSSLRMKVSDIMNVAIETQNRKVECAAKIYIAEYAIDRTDTETATKELLECLNLSRELDDVKQLVQTHIALARVYGSVNMKSRSMENANIALKLAQSNRLQHEIARSKAILGVLVGKQGELVLSEQYLMEAKEFFQGSGDIASLFKTNYNLAYLMVVKGDASSALKYSSNQLSYAKTVGVENHISRAYSINAIIRTKLGKLEDAMFYLDSAFMHIEMIGSNPLISELYTVKFEILNKQGNHKEAFAAQENLFAAKEELASNTAATSLADLEGKYQLAKKEKELLLKQKRVDELQSNRLLIYIALLGLGLLLLVALYFYYLLSQRKKMNEGELIAVELKLKEVEAEQLSAELAQKQSSLADLAHDIAKKNEFAIELVQRIEDLSGKLPSHLKDSINNLRSFSKSNLALKEDYEELDRSTDTVNQALYNALDQKNKGLTEGEKYLAGLIRLGLTNREIAAIKGISTSSAKMSRYRLRKKLGLDGSVDIVQFLSSL